MLKIEIDEEVFAYLQSRAVAFVEKPNDTLRRIFGLNKNKSMYTGANTKPSIKRKKRKTDINELIRAGLLNDGQRVHFRDYGGNKLKNSDTNISPSGILYQGKTYAMSEIAKLLLNQAGYTTSSVRGPAHCFTENGISIKNLWDKYLKNT